MLRFSLAFQLRLFAGGHRGVVTPVPIPNTEVKGSFAEGSAGLARARVGRRRLFCFFLLKSTPLTGCLFLFSEAMTDCGFHLGTLFEDFGLAGVEILVVFVYYT